LIRLKAMVIPLNKALLLMYFLDKVELFLHWEISGEATELNKLFLIKADLAV